MRGRSIFAAFAGLFAVALTGCAAVPPARTLAEAHAATYVFHHPRQEAAVAAAALLVERGFTLEPPRGESLFTAWRFVTDDEEHGDAYQRYRITVHRLTREHSRVTATLVTFPASGLGVIHPRAALRDDGMGRNINTVELAKAGKPSLLSKARAVRDLDFEWEMIRRLEPLGARRIDALVAYELAPSRAR